MPHSRPADPAALPGRPLPPDPSGRHGVHAGESRFVKGGCLPARARPGEGIWSGRAELKQDRVFPCATVAAGTSNALLV